MDSPTPISITGPQTEIVKTILAAMLANDPKKPESKNPALSPLPEVEFKFLLLSYPYDELKIYLKKSVIYACTVENTRFIEALISVMKEMGMEAELDLMMKSIRSELFN
jgi:hypothetical protein